MMTEWTILFVCVCVDLSTHQGCDNGSKWYLFEFNILYADCELTIILFENFTLKKKEKKLETVKGIFYLYNHAKLSKAGNCNTYRKVVRDLGLTEK